MSPEVGVNDALLDEKDEGLGVVEGGGDVGVGAEHLATEPADVDAEDGAFAQDEVVRVDGGGIEIVVWPGRRVGESVVVEDLGGVAPVAHMPDEPQEADGRLRRRRR